MLKKWIWPSIIAIVLVVAWGFVLIIKGHLGVLGWWTLMIFSVAGILSLSLSIIIVIIKLLKKRKVHVSLIVTILLSLFSAWPFGWFFEIGRIAYPANISKTEPAVTVLFPIEETGVIAWGGDSIKTNYHALMPMERWAYDILVEPAAIGSDKLEDYGIYGTDVIAPASGVIVAAYDEEADITPGSEDFKSIKGNHIAILLDETGTYLFIGHLKQGSVCVEVGQHVEAGKKIAQAGNSGTSSEPHVHIHHQRENPNEKFLLAEGLPLYFGNIEGPSMPEGGEPWGDVVTPILDK